MFQTFQQPSSNMTEEEIKQALDAISKKENGNKTLEILNIISYFAPENIHTGMFLSSLGNEEELGAAIKLLKQYLIVDSGQEETTLNVNRLVQKVVRTNLEKQKKAEEILKKALGLLFKNSINSSNLDHTISVWSYVSRYRELIKESSGLPSHIVNELRKCVKYEEANIFGWKALDLLKRTIGESHPATLTLQHNVGTLLGVEGKYKEALEILLPLYEKDVELSGQKEVLDTLIVVARQLCELSRYDEALPIYQSLFGSRQVSETRDRTVLTAWHDYALLLSDLGKYCEPLEILREILKKRSEILGVENDDTLSVKSSIAHIFIKQSKYCEALEVFQEVFDKRMAVLGENHIDTLRTRNDIALVLLNQGKYDEALEIYEVVAKKFEQVLGKEHPDTLATQANLASTFNLKGEYQKALEVYKDVCKKQNETLGQEHNETLRVKHNIASILFKQEKYDEALRTFKEVFQGFNKVFGPEHPDTAAIKNIIGFLSIMSLDTTHSIAREGNLNKMRSLVQNRADINKKDVNENTPLHYAVQYGHISVIRLLLESGAIYNTKNKESKIPLQLTENSTIKNLLNSVAKLFIDVRAGNHKQVAELIIKEKTIINAKEDGGSSFLHWAAHNGHSSIVKLLLESGADATQVTNKGNTPLHVAASKGYKEIVEILLQHVSRDKLKDFIDAKTTVGGTTPLHITAKNGSLDVVKSLLKHGVTYCIKNKEGKTPLDLSKDQNISNLLKLTEELFEDAKNGNVEVIGKLRSVKPDELIAVTKTRNNQGNTLLQVAITNQHKNIASELLEMLKKPDQTLQDINIESGVKSLKL